MKRATHHISLKELSGVSRSRAEDKEILDRRLFSGICKDFQGGSSQVIASLFVEDKSVDAGIDTEIEEQNLIQGHRVQIA